MVPESDEVRAEARQRDLDEYKPEGIIIITACAFVVAIVIALIVYLIFLL